MDKTALGVKYKISVVIPTWNRLERLMVALQSYRVTEYPYVEFIIIDNHSSDGTWEYLLEQSKVDHRIRVFQNPQNIGPFKSLLRGMCECNSPIFLFMADDDILIGDYIKKCVDLFDAYPKLGMVHHYFEGWQHEKKDKSFDIFLAGREAICEAFMKSGSFPGIAWRFSAFNIADFNLGAGSIYQQVELSLGIVKKWDLAIINGSGLCSVNWGDSILKVRSDQNRPSDYGINERLSYLNNLKDNEILIQCGNAFSGWAYETFKAIYAECKQEAKMFINSINIKLIRITPELIILLLKNGYYSVAISVLIKNSLSLNTYFNYYLWLIFKLKTRNHDKYI